MFSMLASVAISVAVLGLSLALAMFLKQKGAIRSDFWGQCILFGPLVILWIVGASSGHTAISSFSCFEGYTDLPNGLLLDSYGNETTRLAVLLECGTGIFGLVFFELVAGAWFITIPLGVKMVLGFE